jgi:hypothetical protein
LRLGLTDQVQIMRGDQNGLAHPVQLDQQGQKAQRHLPVKVAGGFIGQNHIRPHDDGAGKGCALALAARQRGRQRVGKVAKTDPTQQVGQIGGL